LNEASTPIEKYQWSTEDSNLMEITPPRSKDLI